MRVLGLGAGTRARAPDILAFAERMLAGQPVDLVATLDRSHLTGLGQGLADHLGVCLSIVSAEDAGLMAGRCLTRSEASQKAHGLGSVAEAVALAAAGPSGKLEGPRQVEGFASLALATAPLLPAGTKWPSSA